MKRGLLKLIQKAFIKMNGKYWIQSKNLIDITLLQVTPDNVLIKPKTASGMLWLQTHFNDCDWESLARGDAGLDVKHADMMSQDANRAGLHIYYPSPKTFKRKN